MNALGMALFLFAALPLSAQPDLWKAEMDNTLVRVVRRSLAPHETVTVSDSVPGLFVVMTADPVRIAVAGGQAEILSTLGGFFWHNGETLTLTNPGERSVEVARLMPKFRPNPSYRLPSPVHRGVFQNDYLRVRHFMPPPSARGPAPGSLNHPASSVIIELASTVHARFRHISGWVEEVRHKAGDIWYQPEDPWVEELVERGPGHQVLRIELKCSEEKQ